MTSLVSDEARAWIGRSAPPQTIEIHRSDIQKYAIATEQRAAKYLNGDEAPHMFLFGALKPLVPISELGPDGITKDPFVPEVPLKRVMAGGTEMAFHRPILAGDVLTATRTLSEITEKHGSTGPLIFITYALKVENAKGELVLEEKQTRIMR